MTHTSHVKERVVMKPLIGHPWPNLNRDSTNPEAELENIFWTCLSLF